MTHTNDYSHTHCYEQENPPCGFKGKHCCLCSHTNEDREGKCNCAEMSCDEPCTRNHTHKGFWCEKCHPERYEHPPESRNDWEKEAARIAVEAHKKRNSYAEFTRIIFQGIKSLLASKEAEVRKGVDDWAEMYYETSNPPLEEWDGPDEVAASIMSFIEGLSPKQ